MEMCCETHGWQPAIVLLGRVYCGHPDDGCPTNVPRESVCLRKGTKDSPPVYELQGGVALNEAHSRESAIEGLPDLMPGPRYTGSDRMYVERARSGASFYGKELPR